MRSDFRRVCRVLAAACVLLISASSAQATVAHALPDRLAPARDQLRAASASGGSESQHLADRVLIAEGKSSVAPRVAEARLPADLFGPLCPLRTPPRAAATSGRAERLEARSGCDATTRWCRAHATSTQAP